MERVRRFIVGLQPYYLLMALFTGMLSGGLVEKGIVGPVGGVLVAIAGGLLSYLPFALERKEDGQ